MNTIQFFADKNYSNNNASIGAGHRTAGRDLFELQTWLVDIGNGQDEWCGKLHNVSTGDKHFFKGWSGLVENLQKILTPFAQLEVMRSLLPIEEVTY